MHISIHVVQKNWILDSSCHSKLRKYNNITFKMSNSMEFLWNNEKNSIIKLFDSKFMFLISFCIIYKFQSKSILKYINIVKIDAIMIFESKKEMYDIEVNPIYNTISLI